MTRHILNNSQSQLAMYALMHIIYLFIFKTLKLAHGALKKPLHRIHSFFKYGHDLLQNKNVHMKIKILCVHFPDTSFIVLLS